MEARKLRLRLMEKALQGQSEVYPRSASRFPPTMEMCDEFFSFIFVSILGEVWRAQKQIRLCLRKKCLLLVSLKASSE